jgi:hypothetical protein
LLENHYRQTQFAGCTLSLAVTKSIRRGRDGTTKVKDGKRGMDGVAMLDSLGLRNLLSKWIAEMKN